MANMGGVKIVNKSEVDNFLKKALPDSVRFAIANTCDRVVFHGMENSEAQIRDDFILRGGYVVGKTPGKGAIKYEKAIPHRDISQISATWGSVDKAGTKDYGFMEKQEEGFANDDAPVPNPQTTRYAGSQKNRVMPSHYLKNAQFRNPRSFFTGLVGSTKQMMLIGLIRAYREGYGAYGSKQFFRFDDGELFSSWAGGLFQFGQDTHFFEGMSRPNLIRMYYDPKGKSGEKKRRARHWMEKSASKVTQAEIDDYYTEEFNKQLAKNMRNMTGL